jgi:hypothetical protein
VPLAAWTHEPLLQVSVVHVLPSAQVLPSSAWKTQPPFSGLHESSVHGLLSLQMIGADPTQSPAPSHASLVVQAFPSSQVTPLVFGV